MRVISFSLYDNKITYAKGILANAELAKTIYPGWQVYVYVGQRVSQKLKDELKVRGVCVIEVYGEESVAYCTMWRFFAMDMPNVEYILIRDADARLNRREQWVTNDWINRGTDVAVIYDHFNHIVYQMPPGLINIHGRPLDDVTGKIHRWGAKHRWTCDRRFLWYYLWDKTSRSLYANTSICQLSCKQAQKLRRRPYTGFYRIQQELIEIPNVKQELGFCGQTWAHARGHKRDDGQPMILLDEE